MKFVRYVFRTGHVVRVPFCEHLGVQDEHVGAILAAVLPRVTLHFPAIEIRLLGNIFLKCLQRRHLILDTIYLHKTHRLSLIQCLVCVRI